MLMILSPAKTLDFESPPLTRLDDGEAGQGG